MNNNPFNGNGVPIDGNNEQGGYLVNNGVPIDGNNEQGGYLANNGVPIDGNNEQGGYLANNGVPIDGNNEQGGYLVNNGVPIDGNNEQGGYLVNNGDHIIPVYVSVLSIPNILHEDENKYNNVSMNSINNISPVYRKDANNTTNMDYIKCRDYGEPHSDKTVLNRLYYDHGTPTLPRSEVNLHSAFNTSYGSQGTQKRYNAAVEEYDKNKKKNNILNPFYYNHGTPTLPRSEVNLHSAFNTSYGSQDTQKRYNAAVEECDKNNNSLSSNEEYKEIQLPNGTTKKVFPPKYSKGYHHSSSDDERGNSSR